MKFLVVLSIAVACVAADVSHIISQDGQAPIVRYDAEINPDGTYSYQFETGNNILVQQQGSLKNLEGHPTLDVQGTFRYNSPEGPIETTYTADENGYRPVGAHIPVPPAIPEAILRSLEYNRAHPPNKQ